MARIWSLVVIATLVLGASASAAHAQRDPFQPPAEFEQGTPGEEVPAPEAPVEDGAAEAPPERLADTGAEGGPWLAVSYVLVAFGIALVAWSKLRAPHLE